MSAGVPLDGRGAVGGAGEARMEGSWKRGIAMSWDGMLEKRSSIPPLPQSRELQYLIPRRTHLDAPKLNGELELLVCYALHCASAYHSRGRW